MADLNQPIPGGFDPEVLQRAIDSGAFLETSGGLIAA